MVTQNPGGHLGEPPKGGDPSNTNIMMMNSMIGLSTPAKNYDIQEVLKDQPSTSQSNGPPNIEKSDLDPFPFPPKGAPHHTIYNLNSWDSQHYIIVKYLA